ncbi:hypothetical protein AALB64_00770 [Lachnospiraceae bacterium 45-P1]
MGMNFQTRSRAASREKALRV